MNNTLKIYRQYLTNDDLYEKLRKQSFICTYQTAEVEYRCLIYTR